MLAGVDNEEGKGGAHLAHDLDGFIPDQGVDLELVEHPLGAEYEVQFNQMTPISSEGIKIEAERVGCDPIELPRVEALGQFGLVRDLRAASLVFKALRRAVRPGAGQTSVSARARWPCLDGGAVTGIIF